MTIHHQLKSKLRIAVLIRNYTRIGGAERYCVELTECLAEHFDVHLFCQTVETSLHPKINLQYIPKLCDEPRYLNQLAFSRWTRLATEGKFDIVHSHDMVTHANVQTLHVPCVLSFYTDIKGLKKILRCLNTLISPRLLAYLWLEKKQIRTLNQRQIIAVSEYLARNIVRSYPDIANNINTAYPGFHIPESINTTTAQSQVHRQQLGIQVDDFVLLFVSNDYKRKGLLVILQALKTLHKPHIKLVVAGDDNQEHFTAAVLSAGLKGQVYFLGRCHDMHHLYPVADALIHPTLADTYAMVVLEAMAHGIAVIVSNAQYCGIAEHLSCHEALLINNPADAAELAKHIDTLVSDTKLRESLAKKGQDKAQGIHWESTLQQTVHAYQKALQQK